MLMITSTPNGVEGTGKFFHDMWNRAVDTDELFDENEKLVDNHKEIIANPTKNGFVAVRYHWSEIYDDIWYQEQVRELNFNSRRINQELDLMFVAGSNCIFTDEYLSQLRPKKPIEIINLSHMCKLKMYKLLDPGDFYLVGVDTAKSITGDYCVIEVYQYSNFEQVGEFISRIGSLTKFSEVVKDVIDYLHAQIGKKILVGVENNSIGTAIVESLETEIKFDYLQFLYREDPKRNSSVEKPYGIVTTAKSKDKMISLYYDYITADPTLLHSGELISQLSIIEKNSMGTVAAQKGQHDDLFMASCFCALLKKDRQFEIEPLINTNMKNYLKEQEDLIQSIINTDNRNTNVDFSKYFQDAEVSRNIFPTEKREDDLTDIPLPEFF